LARHALGLRYRAALKDFYDQLNLSRHASFEDIRTVINQRKFELERSSFSLSRNSSIERLNAAARVLLNPQLRARYDQEVFRESSPAHVYAQPASTPPPPLASVSAPPSLPIASSTSPPSLPVASSSPPALPVQDGFRAQPPPLAAARTQAAPAIRTSCETCGTKLDPGARHCPVCGTEFPDASAALAPALSESISFSNFLTSVPTETPEQLKSIFRVIGWTCARGTIVSADQPYQVEQEFILSRFLIKTGLIIFALWLAYHWLMRELGILVILLFVVILAAVFMGGLFMLFVGAFAKIFSLFLPSGKSAEKKQVHVRDVRLRDEQLREYIVRFRGELRSGHVAVGDQIEIWGSDRGGTLMARCGYNFRTKSRIWVKYR
jgi:hypothetical protein